MDAPERSKTWRLIDRAGPLQKTRQEEKRRVPDRQPPPQQRRKQEPQQEPQQITACKLVSETDFYLQGHFPAFSVYPGMLLVEGIVQAAEKLFALSGRPEDKEALRTGDWTARFLRPVLPGDTVELLVRLTRDKSGFAVAGEGRVDGELCVKTMMTVSRPCAAAGGAT
ncbi:MaoC/PaaZ C-terminal domain-containing protein [Paenibacillus chitinolyticus]|uniref:3-hydroxyacyl-ACP dehydratase FabZ family protein n=1 Tax=Paenibacillus chitinolyticus TaxID=79263 RepID=UPI002DBF2146|nr:hypothetical protein [Paenibacillus chitinolyticus]MEC0246726.1 MaoC/PaaZ C-terminal domain-containing protein [Paenibacillus chitinolyticus]